VAISRSRLYLSFQKAWHFQAFVENSVEEVKDSFIKLIN
jgi:hypothetical protein